jgi:hypothetical protein
MKEEEEERGKKGKKACTNHRRIRHERFQERG